MERIPTVVGREPVWDRHDENRDPLGEMILADGRETLATTTLEAQDRAVAKMPEDSIWPLILSLCLGLMFVALLTRTLWVALAGFVLTAMAAARWMWPAEPEKAP